MIFEVELRAFGNPGEVNVPDDQITGTDSDLDLVFHYGQNDFQPQQHPSVSVGDVIRFGNRKVLVAPIGFENI